MPIQRWEGTILRRADFSNRIARSDDCCCGPDLALCTDLNYQDPFNQENDEWTWHGHTQGYTGQVNGGVVDSPFLAAYLCRSMPETVLGATYNVFITLPSLSNGGHTAGVGLVSGNASPTPAPNQNNPGLPFFGNWGARLFSEGVVDGAGFPVSFEWIAQHSSATDGSNVRFGTGLTPQSGDVARVSVTENAGLYDFRYFVNGNLVHTVLSQDIFGAIPIGSGAEWWPFVFSFEEGVIGGIQVPVDDFAYTMT